MIKTKGWDWKIIKDKNEETWKNPSIESYYLLNSRRKNHKLKKSN